MTVQSLASQTN